ncbi:MAG: AI-2E family transporter [Firmicutes bacterium]|nr:AI-2E family transporter [Bacillota bacterium]
MKLPWDENYLKISFHVVVTAVAVFVAIMLMARLKSIMAAFAGGLGFIVSVFSPLMIAVAASFLFDPLVSFYQKRFGRKQSAREFKTRKAGTTLAYITIFGVVAVIITTSVKSLGAADISQLSSALNGYIEEISQTLFSIQRQLSRMGVLSGINGFINTMIVRVTQSAKGMVVSFASSMSSVGKMALKLVIGLVIAFYFLVEKDRMIFRVKDTAMTFMPKRIREPVGRFFADVNKVFRGYVVGQVTDALIMALLIIICFEAAGIKYAVVIGLISGFSNLIPYVGAVVAFVLSVLVGLLSGNPIKAVYAAAIVIVLQQVDSLIIVPKVVGKNVQLHPALVILSLSVFGSLFGLWGMVFAVPVTSLIKINVDRYYEKRKNEERGLQSH